MRLMRLLTPLLMAALAAPLLAAAAPAPTSPHDWINSPEAYFVTSEERALWDRTVLTDEQAKAFVDQYWQKHGAAFKREVLTRLEAADKYFGMGGVPGSKTAKGRVFMILGSPSNQRGQGRARRKKVQYTYRKRLLLKTLRPTSPGRLRQSAS